MNIAVVDAGGNLVAHVRMDGAFFGSVAVSIDKAWTTAAFQCPTAALGALMATPFAFEYDLVILALPMAWLGVLGQSTGWRHGEVLALGLAFVLPIAAPGVAGLTHVQLGPWVLGALLWLLWRRG